MSEKITRREFFRVAIVSTATAVLAAACGPEPRPQPTPNKNAAFPINTTPPSVEENLATPAAEAFNEYWRKWLNEFSQNPFPANQENQAVNLSESSGYIYTRTNDDNHEFGYGVATTGSPSNFGLSSTFFDGSLFKFFKLDREKINMFLTHATVTEYDLMERDSISIKSSNDEYTFFPTIGADEFTTNFNAFTEFYFGHGSVSDLPNRLSMARSQGLLLSSLIGKLPYEQYNELANKYNHGKGNENPYIKFSITVVNEEQYKPLLDKFTNTTPPLSFPITQKP